MIFEKSSLIYKKKDLLQLFDKTTSVQIITSLQNLYNIGKFLEGEQFRLGIAGFYPSRIKRTFLVNLTTVFTYFITFGQMAAVMNFVFSTNELAKISEVFLFSMTQVAFINKILNFHIKSKKAVLLDQMISQEIFTKVTTVERDMMETAFRKCQRVTSAFIYMCGLVVVLYGVFPATDNKGTGKKNYPFPGKFPFNPDNYYLIIYMGEVTTVAVSAWCNGTLDCLFAKHTTIATTLFALLCEKIKALLDDADKNDNKIVQNRIKDCVVYYNEIISYVLLIENTFSYGILVQFLCSAVVICLTGFQLTLVISFRSAQFGLMAVYFLCMMFQLILYCWYGHMLMEKSDGITKACYAVDWNEMSIKEQKMLITIMERAKRPVALQAAGMFRLNLSTFMAVLRSSYSYFAVLRQIYSK